MFSTRINRTNLRIFKCKLIYKDFLITILKRATTYMDRDIRAI